MQTLADANFLFLDCQTTGATPSQGSLLEVAWCNSLGLSAEPSEISSYLIKQPGEAEIPRRIQTITGITPGDMESAVDEGDFFHQLIRSLKLAESNRAVIHFAQFERPFLEDLFERHGRSQFPLALICTHQIAKRLYPNLPARGIRGLAGFFGASTHELKRSINHVQLTRIIWNGLTSELITQGVCTVQELEEWLKEPVKIKRTRYQYIIDDKKRLSLPDLPGIYRMLNKQGDILYVGKATSLRNRVNSYFRGQKGKESNKLEMLTQTWDISYQILRSALEAALAETDEIKAHNPPYNINLKRGRRQLAFYSRNFDSFGHEQSVNHPLGPFPNALSLDPFIRLVQSLSDQKFDPFIFFDPIPDPSLSAGFVLFCDSHNLKIDTLSNGRALMAVALKLLKAERKAALDGGDVEGQDIPEAIDDRKSSGESNADEAVREYTVEEVADKYHRLLLRSARLYLRSKELTKLLHCTIEFYEKGEPISLHFRDGKVAEQNALAVSRDDGAPWQHLGIDTYDRISILLAELVRLKANGQLKLISPL